MCAYRRNINASSDKKSNEDIFAEQLTENVIQCLKGMKDSNWEKGWATASFIGNPENIEGRQYSGNNRLILSLDAARKGYSMPVYMTYYQASQQGAKPICKNDGTSIIHVTEYYKYNDGRKGTLSAAEYEKLPLAEKKNLDKKKSIRRYPVWNIDNTNFKEKNPERYAELMQKFRTQLPRQKDTNGMYVNPALDRMLEKHEWICPIEYQKQSSRAFYQPGNPGSITIPQKSQFNKGGTPEEIYNAGKLYYKTLIHEMAHSTAAKLSRETGKKFGDPKYGREELVAELSAALVCNAMGFGTQIYKDNIKYVNNWLEALNKEPEFIKTVMKDVSKASNEILNKIDEQRKILGEEPLNRSFQEIEKEKAATESKSTEGANQKPEAAIQTEAPVASQTNVEAPSATSRSAAPQKTGSVKDTEAVTVSVLHDTDGNGVVNLSDAANQDALIDAMARSANPGLKDADIKKIADCLKIIAAQTHTGPMKTDARARPLGGNNEPPRDQDRGPRGRGGRE